MNGGLTFGNHCGHGQSHRQPVIAMAVYARALKLCWPVHNEAVSGLLNPGAHLFEFRDGRGDSIGLFNPQLLGIPHNGPALGLRGCNSQNRQLVDHRDELRAAEFHALQPTAADD